MGYDNAIQHIGQFGRYQRKVFLVLCLPAVSWGFMKMGSVFLAAKPDFRCLLPHESPGNSTYQLPLNITDGIYPWDYETKLNWSQCERYDPEFSNLRHNASVGTIPSTFSTMKCDSFVYDKTQYTLTVTTEWDLVCDNAWSKTMSDCLFMLADVPGVFIFGALSDKYGRKLSLLVGVIIQFISAVLIAFSPNFITYTILRVIGGMTISGVYLITYISAVEMVSAKNRIAAATGISLSYIMGYTLIPGLAYLITNWRTLQIVFTISNLLFLLFSREIPESVRWLLSKGRVEEAKDILRKASSKNGVELLQDALDDLLEDNGKRRPVLEKMSMLDILRYPNLRKKSLLLFFLWFVISVAYYGLSWNTSNLGGNDYINFGIAAAVELPSQIFVFTTINRWGRKPILCGGLFISGISLILTFLVPANMPWLMVLLAMIGKAAITVCYSAVYVFTAEQYPTPIRNVGSGACSAAARLGSAVAPFIDRLFEISSFLPLVILGSSTLVAGLSALFLPETLNKSLSESAEECEQLEKSLSQLNIKRLNDVNVTTLATERETGVCKKQNLLQ